MIDKTLFAVSTDETRFNLSGVYVETRRERARCAWSRPTAIASRMVDRAVADAKLAARRDHAAQGSGRGAQAARRDRGGRADARRSPRRTCACTPPAVSFFMRLVEGEFPDYQQVIPSEHARRRRSVNRDDLLAALRRMSLLASERSHGVQAAAASRARSSSRRAIPTTARPARTSRSRTRATRSAIGFNARYLIDVLARARGGRRRSSSGSPTRSGPGSLRGSQDPELHLRRDADAALTRPTAPRRSAERRRHDGAA